MQAATALAARRSFPSGSAAHQSSMLGQDTGSPCMHGNTCGVQDSTAELRNVPSAHLATGQANEVPIYHPGTLYRCLSITVVHLTRNNVKIKHVYSQLLPVITYY